MFIDYFVFFIYCYDPDIKLSIDSIDNLECFKKRITSKFYLDTAVIDECATEEEIRNLVIRTITDRKINDESKFKRMFIDYFVLFILCYDADIKSRISNTKESKEELNVLRNTELTELLIKSTAQKEFERKLLKVSSNIKSNTERMHALITHANSKGNVKTALMIKDALNHRTKNAIVDLLRKSPSVLTQNNKTRSIANSLKHVNPVLSKQLLLASGNNTSIHKLLLHNPAAPAAPAVRAAAPAAPAVRTNDVTAIERNATILSESKYISPQTLKKIRKAKAIAALEVKEAKAALEVKEAKAALEVKKAEASSNWENISSISSIRVPE
jgi:hypothetical protein